MLLVPPTTPTGGKPDMTRLQALHKEALLIHGTVVRSLRAAKAGSDHACPNGPVALSRSIDFDEMQRMVHVYHKERSGEEDFRWR